MYFTFYNVQVSSNGLQEIESYNNCKSAIHRNFQMIFLEKYNL